MSLINQALKRAQEAQDQTPPEPLHDLHFRPVEPAHRTRHSLGLVVPISLAVVALLLLFLVWQSVQQNRVAARGVQPAPAETSITTPAPEPVGPLGTVISQPSDPAPVTEPSESITPEPPGPEPAPAVVATPQPPPKPAPPRLQGIIFSPVRPSAVINGKTLFLGDRFGDQRVLAIDKESATLVGGGQTNVLTLEQ
jgi:hypothetical protein